MDILFAAVAFSLAILHLIAFVGCYIATPGGEERRALKACEATSGPRATRLLNGGSAVRGRPPDRKGRAMARIKVARGRMALRARLIAGRRYRHVGPRGMVQAIVLAPNWAPWRSETEASQAERRWRVREASYGRPVGCALPWPGEGACLGCQTSDRRGLADGGLAEAEEHGRRRHRDHCSAGASSRRSMPLASRLILATVAVAALANCRIGEAANPGPGTERPAGNSEAVLVDAVNGGGVQYPAPHRDGFRDIATPGHENLDAGRESRRGEEQFKLLVETVNSTGWGPLQRRLTSTSAHVVLAQETWILPCQVAMAQGWARRRGWHSVWAPAVVGPGGGASGGVAILARTELGLRYPIQGSHIVEEARAVAGFVNPPGHRPILLASVYLRDGKGAGADNRATLARVGACASAQGAGCLPLVGGDFQCCPSDIEGTGFPEQIKGQVMAARSTRGTYRTTTVASTLDFYVVAQSLAEVVEDVRLAEGTGIKGHVPVQMTFAPRPVALKALAVRKPPDLPIERVFGPIPPPQDWGEAKSAAAAAIGAATRGAAAAQVQRAIDVAYERWCHVAEAEVADVTGSTPSVWGLRGQRPKLRWASVLPEVTPKGAPSAAAAATHMRSFVTELRRIAGCMESGAGEGIFIDPSPSGCNRPHGATFATPVRGGYGSSHREGRGPNARGGRPRPPADLAACETIVGEILEEIAVESAEADEEAADRPLLEETAAAAARVQAAIQGMRRAAFHDDIGLRDDLAELGGRLAEAEKTAERERDKESQRRWKEWLEADWQKGASRAHAATRTPTEWRPTVATADDGTVSAAPMAVLEATRRKYAAYWGAVERPVEYRWNGDCPPLPRLTAAQLRSASLAFSRRTSSTYDGWHVRHIGLLSDGGLEALAMLLEAVERTSRWPAQTSLVTSPMIEKARGGHRLIGKLTALYRVWAKARRHYAEEWESAHERPFFATASGTGPVDAVYRQSMRQEAATASGQAAVTILEDMESFYETVDRNLLIREAREMGFPTCLVRACLAAYAAPRIITFGRAAAKEMHAERGIIAGCSFATTLVNIFTYGEWTPWPRRFRRASNSILTLTTWPSPLRAPATVSRPTPSGRTTSCDASLPRTSSAASPPKRRPLSRPTARSACGWQRPSARRRPSLAVASTSASTPRQAATGAA